MKKATILALTALLATLAAGPPAGARTPGDRLEAAQVKKGLAAFKRQDYATASLLLPAPASHGHAGAQTVLCFMHTFGRGVPQDYRIAAGWCTRAAAQGNAEAQYMLGLLYNKGHGVPEDFVEAYKWLNLAATRATGPKKDFSYRLRDSVAFKMSPKQIAKAQALSTAWRPVLER